jgi:hypothetical protein
VRRGKLLAGPEPKAGFIGVLGGIRDKLTGADGCLGSITER